MRTLFRNLWLADGSGSPLRRSAVLVDGERILAVEPEITASAADRTVELRGRILSPGFIDVHGHSDLALAARPEGFGKISQGISCEIMGNCGYCQAVTRNSIFKRIYRAILSIGDPYPVSIHGMRERNGKREDTYIGIPCGREQVHIPFIVFPIAIIL